MKKLALACLTFVTICNTYGAEERLTQLSKTLSDGSYKYADDLEGSIPRVRGYPGWSINCHKDKFDNAKQCALMKSDLMVMFRNGHSSVFIGRNHYPGSESAIKVDDNSSIYGHEGLSKLPQKAIQQMQSGKTLFTRYVEWPHNYNQDGEIDLSGFKENYAEMLNQYSKL